ncbi:ABC transporter ATP-binding protein [Candidatus Peregrinibacteria bacterium]|nr:MAG: ABC transporter ATP-binding protein [Candidatus Peregrinibacteria bacterium]
MKLRRGERIAFVGESGSGKSTMMSLLRGLSEPNRVQVVVDGVTVGGLRSLSDLVTLIPQDPEIFENTIEYNITAGIRHKKIEVEEVVKMARFDAVLRRLPSGLKTSIKEKGVNLSGGEKQRLALARGLFAAKKSSIVLLDEPTSSVDPANELGIYDNIFEQFKDKCLVSSVHRLHLLPKFDKIYLFRSGAVVAEGTFAELLKKSPDFKKAWSLYRKSKGVRQ